MLSAKWRERLMNFIFFIPMILVIFFTIKSCDKKECIKSCFEFKNVEKQFNCMDMCNK